MKKKIYKCIIIAIVSSMFMSCGGKVLSDEDMGLPKGYSNWTREEQYEYHISESAKLIDELKDLPEPEMPDMIKVGDATYCRTGSKYGYFGDAEYVFYGGSITMTEKEIKERIENINKRYDVYVSNKGRTIDIFDRLLMAKSCYDKHNRILGSIRKMKDEMLIF